MGLALLASLLHLNNLVNVVNAVPNLGSSWLSREVVLAVTFVVLAAIYTFLQWRKIGGNTMRTLIGWITAVIGVAQIYAMGMVYMIRTQPAESLATPINFFVTALLLGGLAVAVAMMIMHTQEEKQLPLFHEVLQGIALGAVILLGIEFLILPIYMAYLATQRTVALGGLNTSWLAHTLGLWCCA